MTQSIETATANLPMTLDELDLTTNTLPMTLDELDTTEVCDKYDIHRVWEEYLKTVCFEYETEQEENYDDDDDSFFEEYYDAEPKTELETEPEPEEEEEQPPGWTKQPDGWLVKIGRLAQHK